MSGVFVARETESDCEVFRAELDGVGGSSDLRERPRRTGVTGSEAGTDSLECVAAARLVDRALARRVRGVEGGSIGDGAAGVVSAVGTGVSSWSEPCAGVLSSREPDSAASASCTESDLFVVD